MRISISILILGKKQKCFFVILEVGMVDQVIACACNSEEERNPGQSLWRECEWTIER